VSGDFPAALKEALERSLGFALKPLERLDGNIALNFKASRVSDGFTFAVKCSPPERREAFARLLTHLEELEGTKAVSRIFSEGLSKFRDYDVVCLSWCAGERLFPDRLTETEMAAFADDYLAFSAALQKTSMILLADPVLDWRAQVLARCSGFWSRGIRRLLERELTVEGLTYDPKLMKTVHGDLHHGNFLFSNGCVTGYFDLEDLCRGYPSDDIVRYFVCASEHLRWHEQHRRRRILELFAIVVKRMPYSAHEWNVALNALLMRKVFAKSERGPLGLVQTMNLVFRARFYAALRKIAGRLSAPEVRAALENSLHVGIRSLEPMDVPCTAHCYRATDANGRDLFVKVMQEADSGDRPSGLIETIRPKWDGGRATRFLSRHCGHRLLPKSLLAEPVLVGRDRMTVCAFETIRHVRIEDMADAQFSSFARGCVELAELMKTDADLAATWDYDASVRIIAEQSARSPFGRRLFGGTFGFGALDYTYPGDTKIQPVHADFSARNCAFNARGELSGFLDFDDLELGSPVEPMAAIFMQAIRKNKVWFNLRKRRIMADRLHGLQKMFARPAVEWRVAFNRVRIKDALFAFENHPRHPLKAAWNFYWRDRRTRWLQERLLGSENGLPMRVMNLMLGAGAGGLEAVAFQYARVLASAGCESAMVVNRRSPYVAANGVGVFRAHGASLLNPLNHFAVLRAVCRFRPDAVLCHGSRGAQFCSRLLRWLSPQGTRFMGVCHGSNGWRFRKFQTVIAVSDGVREELVGRWGLPADSVVTCRNAIRLPSVEDSRLETGEVPVLGFLGRLDFCKGLDLLVMACARLKEKGIAFRLDVGGTGPESDALRKLVEDSGLALQVRWLGWVTDKRRFFRPVSVLVMPSREEGLPVALLEGLSYGRMAVVSDCPGMKFVVEDAGCGLVVPRGDVAGLAAVLERVLTDGNLRSVLCQRARAAIERDYSETGLRDRLMQVLG